METKKEFLEGFEECFITLKDSRQKTKIEYSLLEILLLSITAVAGGAFSWSMIESFGNIHLNSLREYYPFKTGCPSDDTIRRVFELLNPKHLNESLQKYFTRTEPLKNKHIAMDGKTAKGSGKFGSQSLHMLNVYASESGLTLFSKNIDKKTNEITAIPEALDLLDVSGAIITIDAIGCQKNIAQKIINKGADYILGLKRNQVSLYNEVEDAFATNAEIFFNMDKAVSKDIGHGRICFRTCRVINNLTRFPIARKWAGIKSLIEVKRKTIIKNKQTTSTNYYISSCNLSSKIILQNIRNHWKIESMHWMLDVIFKEDHSTMHKGNVPANMAIIRKFVLNILSQIKKKRQSRPLLMKLIGWSPEYLHKL